METSATKDWPADVVIQWSNRDVVPWAWLTNVKASGKNIMLSVKHKLFMSQNSISSVPKIDVIVYLH